MISFNEEAYQAKLKKKKKGLAKEMASSSKAIHFDDIGTTLIGGTCM